MKAVFCRNNLFASRFFVVSCFVCCVISAPVFAASKGIEQRLSRIERLLDNQNLLQMYTTQQELMREISGLRGDLDLVNHELEKLKKQQKDIYLDLDQRIQDLEKSISGLKSIPPMTGFPAGGVSAPPSTDAAAAPVTPPATAPTSAAAELSQNSVSEQESYQGALSMLKNAQYKEAIEAFKIFLISYPASSYAANAQYWMSEAHYVLKDFNSAISNFKKVIDDYPNSRKTADAHLKIGFSHYELKDWKKAQEALEKVMADHPNSTAARLAKRRIEKMKLEGHL